MNQKLYLFVFWSDAPEAEVLMWHKVYGCLSDRADLCGRA